MFGLVKKSRLVAALFKIECLRSDADLVGKYAQRVSLANQELVAENVELKKQLDAARKHEVSAKPLADEATAQPPDAAPKAPVMCQHVDARTYMERYQNVDAPEFGTVRLLSIRAARECRAQGLAILKPNNEAPSKYPKALLDALWLRFGTEVLLHDRKTKAINEAMKDIA